MNIDNLIKKMEKVFLDLGFQTEYIGEKNEKYMHYNNCYCKISYLESLSACVIESADCLEDVVRGVLEDGELYLLDNSEAEILSKLRQDLKNYYME